MKTLEFKWTELAERTKRVLVPDNYQPAPAWKVREQVDELDDHGTRRVIDRSDVTVTAADYDPDAEVLVEDPDEKRYTAAIYDPGRPDSEPAWEWLRPATLRNVLAAALVEIQNAEPRAVFTETLPNAVYHVYATTGGLIDKKPIAVVVVEDADTDQASPRED
ncbi:MULTISPECIES: hypothetical protein [Mycobacteroides]|uniref:hypothetical protein n=1 Tax=Mycobacteroides TaxID=670516 RepID=UPI0009926BD9|nr:hypothetical protein [Mycobacteroides chelonae]MBE5452977.1 hypothetical protein [Mycobacteroides abscessus]